MDFSKVSPFRRARLARRARRCGPLSHGLAWHFYVGLCVMPFILVLSLTGAAFLFKAQLDRRYERRFQNLPQVGPVVPSAQRDAAVAASRKVMLRRHCCRNRW